MPQRPEPRPVAPSEDWSGFVVVDKPPGLSSHDIVAILRAVTGVQKVGHTGTLDPFATGVLPLALGRATRLIQHLDESQKVYEATVQFGAATDTADPTGQVVATGPHPELPEDRVREVLQSFLGERMQTPPRYSAVKIDGRPLYAYARAGQEVEAKARPIRITAMELVSIFPAIPGEGDAPGAPPALTVRIYCSRGTYARVIGEEIGVALGTVAHLSALRRLRSGPFTLDRALSLAKLSTIVAGTDDWIAAFRTGRNAPRVPWRPRPEVLAGLAAYRTPAREALAHLPALTLSDADARHYAQGVAPAEVRGKRGPLLLIAEGEVLGVHTGQ